MGAIKILDHAKKRINERVDSSISIQDIQSVLTRRGITSGRVTFARKDTNSRTIIYGETEKGPFKAVYSRKHKLIITILPMKYIFKTDWIYINYNQKQYRMILYPDCYMETKNPKMMTKFEIFEDNYWLLCGRKEPLFTEIFCQALELSPYWDKEL